MNRILGAKFGSCSGQACIAVDYVLVEKGYASTLVWKQEKLTFFFPFFFNFLKAVIRYQIFNCLGGINEGVNQENVR